MRRDQKNYLLGTVLPLVPSANATHRCGMALRNTTFIAMNSSSVLHPHTTSDIIPRLREIVEIREAIANEGFSRNANGAWFHSSLCPTHVSNVLRQLFHIGERTRSDSATLRPTTLIPAGTKYIAWTAGDIAFAEMIAPTSKYVVFGKGNASIQLQHQQQMFNKHCKRLKKEQGHIKLACTKSFAPLSPERMFFVDCDQKIIPRDIARFIVDPADRKWSYHVAVP